MGEFKLVFRSEIILAPCINDHIPVITEGKRYTPGPGLGKDADLPFKILQFIIPRRPKPGHDPVGDPVIQGQACIGRAINAKNI